MAALGAWCIQQSAYLFAQSPQLNGTLSHNHPCPTSMCFACNKTQFNCQVFLHDSRVSVARHLAVSKQFEDKTTASPSTGKAIHMEFGTVHGDDFIMNKSRIRFSSPTMNLALLRDWSLEEVCSRLPPYFCCVEFERHYHQHTWCMRTSLSRLTLPAFLPLHAHQKLQTQIVCGKTTTQKRVKQKLVLMSNRYTQICTHAPFPHSVQLWSRCSGVGRTKKQKQKTLAK